MLREGRPKESLTAANLFSAFAYHFFYSHSILSTLLYHTLLFYTYSLTLEYIHRLDTDNDARLFSRNQNRSLISRCSPLESLTRSNPRSDILSFLPAIPDSLPFTPPPCLDNIALLAFAIFSYRP